MSLCPELTALESFHHKYTERLQSFDLCTVKADGHTFPVRAYAIGNHSENAPVFGIFAGVHGLEAIGTRLALYYLNSLISRLDWDEELQARLEQCRLVAIPAVNPGGLQLSTRANPTGVDLMRNAPHDSVDPAAWLFGGHRIGNWLPWYRGHQKLEAESQALIDFVTTQMLTAPFALAIDLHSGFGMHDRLWYPYAKQKNPFPYHKEAEKIALMMRETHPSHIYRIEPQADSYITHGDLWDHLTDLHYAQRPESSGCFIPWTLEMGSWRWVRKNPLQLFSQTGIFNPVRPHRDQRVMRRHLFLLEFLFRLTRSYQKWL